MRVLTKSEVIGLSKASFFGVDNVCTTSAIYNSRDIRILVLIDMSAIVDRVVD